MSTNTDIPRLQRVTFFDGQRLSAADLGAAQAFHRELRWLHNRSLHTWGIALGLGVTGEKDDRQVAVAPGYAVDCLGREIVLTESHVEPIPPVAGAPGGGEATYYLTVAYAPDGSLTPVETQQGVCARGGAVRLPEAPRFAWRRPDEVERGIELVLAQIWVLNCALNRPVSLEPRRNARPSQQPYIAADRTSPGATAWSFLPETGSPANALGVKTVVDTSGARFRLTPRYLAHVVGSRVLREPGTAVVTGTAGFLQPGHLIEGFARIVNQTAAGFELQMYLPRWPRGLTVGPYLLNPNEVFVPATLTTLQSSLMWHVVWLGVEG